jgi:phosphoglycolate phosphatase
LKDTGPWGYSMTGVRFAVLLFDIDGTLVHAGGAGRRALELAMDERLGPAARRGDTWLEGIKLDGMTDRRIVREAMLAAGQAFDDALCDRILGTYTEELEREIENPGYAVLPGVRELLEELSARRATIGLCTGNVLRGARIKLARGGLDRHFGFGAGDVHGFASDGEAREHIVAAALRRAAERLGRRLDPGEALVIGDTPRDVAAARAVGCPALAVATGRFGVQALRAEGADHVVPTLERTHVAKILFHPAAA